MAYLISFNLQKQLITITFDIQEKTEYVFIKAWRKKLNRDTNCAATFHVNCGGLLTMQGA